MLSTFACVFCVTLGSPNNLTFTLIGTDLYPSVSFNSTTFLIVTNPIDIVIQLSDNTVFPLDTSHALSLISVTGANKLSFIQNNLLDNTTYILQVSATAQIIWITFPQNMTQNNIGRPNTAASWSMIYEPTINNMPPASFEPMVALRDNSNRWLSNKPIGGWVVTAIHFNLLPLTGEVLVTGWSRIEEFACTGPGARRQVETFMPLST